MSEPITGTGLAGGTFTGLFRLIVKYRNNFETLILVISGVIMVL